MAHRINEEKPKEKEDCPQGVITTELCKAYRETMCERIDSLKKTIWASAATVGFVITVIEIILRFSGR